MIPQTIGRKHDIGKIAEIQCIKNDSLKAPNIKDQCFLLALVYEGEARFEVGDKSIPVHAPCFLCFDETDNPRLIKKHGLRCDVIYFHPKFFNLNLSFEHVHSEDFTQAAMAHDLFLMKPFTDKERYSYLMLDEYIENAKRLFDCLATELDEQSDWYWSCRCRTFFIELLFMLERVYNIMSHGNSAPACDRIKSNCVNEAVTFMEGHFREEITLDTLAKAASVNRTSLTLAFKEELGMPPIEYLWYYRITIAKRHLQFTNLPIGEIAARCGFKTVQHFSRKFEEQVGKTPSAFREWALTRRKNDLNDFQ